jgi:hypothetical protein
MISICKKAVEKGTFLWPSKSTYRLLDYKAATSNFDGFEYPIRFLQDDKENEKIKPIKQIKPA